MWPSNGDVPMEDETIMTPDQESNHSTMEEMGNTIEKHSNITYDSDLSNNAPERLSAHLNVKLDLTKSSTSSTCFNNPKIEQFLSLFKELSGSDQKEAINQLIDTCSISNIRYLRHLIEPHFQRDFFSYLPVEIGVKILEKMDGFDIIQLARVSKNWRTISELECIWRPLYDKLSLDLAEPTNRVNGAWNNTAISPGVFIPDHITGIKFQEHRYNKLHSKKGSVYYRAPDKSRYMRAMRILQNWRVKPIKGSCILRGHEDHVITCMQIHGDLLVTGSDDNTLKVWSIDRGECLYVLTGHTGGVWTSQISSCGRFIASGSTDRTVKVWSAVDGSFLYSLQGHTSTVRCMAIWKNILVTGSRDTTLRVWDIEKGFCITVLLGHRAAVRCVQFDGSIIISGGYDFTVKIWSYKTRKCLRTLIGHTNRIYSLLFDRERSIVASGSLDTTIRVWDFTKSEGDECIAVLEGHTSLTSGMQLKGDLLVSCNADSHVRVWDIRDGSCLFHLNGHRSAITSLQFFGESTLATSSDDGTVKLWDIEKGVFLRDLVSLGSGGNGGCIWRLCATPTLLACAVGSRNNTEETKVILIDFDSVYP